MGEKIKVINNIDLENICFDIELNEATISGGPRYIHIQNNNFRICFKEAEYFMIVTTIFAAYKNLIHIKGIRDR